MDSPFIGYRIQQSTKNLKKKKLIERLKAYEISPLAKKKTAPGYHTLDLPFYSIYPSSPASNLTPKKLTRAVSMATRLEQYPRIINIGNIP